MVFLQSRRAIIALLAVASSFLLSLGISAEAQVSREALKNPIYRINKAGVAAEPVADKQSSVSAIQATMAPLAVATSVAEPSLSSRPKMSQSVEVASRTPILAPVEPRPSEILGYAIVDAKIQLAHILENVDDYTCDFVKRERVKGELLPAEHISLKVRHRKSVNGQVVKPFSVYMKFKAPNDQRNREILFIEGQNNGKLLAKEGGARGKWLPSVWLNTDSSFVMKTNRYPITEVGIQRLTERLIESAEANVTADLCKIKFTRGAKVNGRKCSYLEVVRDVRQAGPLGPNNVFLVQLFLDEELQVPVRYAAYDWPGLSGERPVPLEEYTYQNLKLNAGLTAADFDKNNPQYNF